MAKARVHKIGKRLKAFNGRAPASGPTGTDGYKPVTRDDVSDLALLPRRFDLFAAEVKQGFEMLANQILPKLDRIVATQTDQGYELTQLRRDHTQLTKRVAELERRGQVQARKPRKKTRTR